MAIENPFISNAPTYGGPRVAGFDPVRARGINLATEAALGPQQQLADAYTSGILDIARGTDEGTRRLATRAGAATAAPYSGAGILGSTYHQDAANRAAADAILDRQFRAFQQIPYAQTASAVPSTTLQNVGQTTQAYDQSLIDAEKAAFDERQRTQGNQYTPPVQPTAIQQVGNTASNIASTAGAIGSAFNALSGLGDTFGFFAEGGEVMEKPMSARYQKAKMRKMGG